MKDNDADIQRENDQHEEATKSLLRQLFSGLDKEKATELLSDAKVVKSMQGGEISLSVNAKKIEEQGLNKESWEGSVNKINAGGRQYYKLSGGEISDRALEILEGFAEKGIKEIQSQRGDISRG